MTTACTDRLPMHEAILAPFSQVETAAMLFKLDPDML